jgi:hypothetical protein
MLTGAADLLTHTAGTTVRAEDTARKAQMGAEIVGSGYLADIGFGSLWSMIDDKLARLNMSDNLIQIDPRTNSVRGKFRFKATDVTSI